ncbi:MAG TPA: ATP-binding protein [Steroidobacteraceae bacterium]
MATATQPWTRYTCLAVAAYAIVGGLVSFLAWPLDRPEFADWFGSGISIQPNAAICVILAGLAVALATLGQRRAGAWVGLLVALIGGLTLCEWVTGLSFGIDSLGTFDRAWGRAGVIDVGRMGLPASTSWTLLGTALWISGRQQDPSGRSAPVLALVTFGIALLSITGYLYRADVLYSLPRATAIALQTATFIAAIAVAVLSLHPARAPMRWLQNPGAVGVIARRGIPLVLLAPIVLGWLRLEGERAGHFDAAFGMALLVLFLIALLGVMLWRGLSMLSAHEAALLAAEERVRLAVTAGDAATWDLDLVTGVDVRSDSYFQLLGHDPQAARSAKLDLWESVVVPEDLPAVRQEWWRAVEAHDLFRSEHRLTRRDGSVMWVRSAGRFFYDDAGRKAVRFVGVFVDVTDEKRAIEQLQEADRRKDEFLAILAHELRNPLAPMRNAIALLRAKGLPSPELQWARDVIERQMEQLTRLIDDLLDMSRIRSGKIQLRRERIDLAQVVHGAVEASRPLLDQYAHQLAIELPAEPIPLHGDLVRLAQVFCNLLNNAARYTPRGGSISITAGREGATAVVRVRDNGIGIPADMLPKIFDMFTQVDRSLERTRGGLGIGLTLVRKLVELHGGTIEARSGGAGQGCEFIVRLPVAEPATGTVPAPSPRETARTAPASRRILVVDDNRDAADGLALLLQTSGHEVQVAYDGCEAVRAARAFQPDLVFMDIGLPGLNGYDAARAIRGEPWGQRMALVALTGWGQDEDRRRSREAGFDHHLVKPVSFEDALQVLAETAGAAREPADVAT